MKNRNRLLYALVLLPTLLLTSCYKDFDKVRVKPFKPDLVVPLAKADNITFADMLVKEVDLKYLDSISYKDEGRIGLRYDTFTYNNIALALSPSLENLIIKGGDVLKEGLISGNSSSLKVQKIVFAEGAEISATKDITLSLEDGSELKLNATPCAPLRKGCTLKLPINASNDCILTFENKDQSVEAVEVKIGTLQGLGGVPRTVTLDTYAGLLWYSGELTDPRVAVKITPEGWTARVEKLKYWVEGSSVKTRVDGKEEEKPLVGQDGENPLPFNESGRSKFFDYWEKGGAIQEKEYLFNRQISMVTFSKEWPLSYTVGKLAVECKDQVVTLHAGEGHGSLKAGVALKLPFTGRFNALIREFKAEDKEGIELPDVNKLLQDSGGKGRVKSTFTKNDTVLLHFYFKNATPMDIYLAAKIGKMDAESKEDKTALRASEIEGLSSGIDSEKLEEKVGSLTIGDFKFFKAVEGADAGGKYGIAMGSKSKVVTIPIPYSEYEKAQKDTVNKRQVRALLLFRSPNGTDGQPIVVSPRLTDYVSVRLGVEVKPEVLIELMNKK